MTGNKTGNINYHFIKILNSKPVYNYLYNSQVASNNNIIIKTGDSIKQMMVINQLPHAKSKSRALLVLMARSSQ